jgi:hypothetical protein
LIVSNDFDDIIQTIKILNDTYINSTKNFLDLVNREFYNFNIKNSETFLIDDNILRSFIDKSFLWKI